MNELALKFEIDNKLINMISGFFAWIICFAFFDPGYSAAILIMISFFIFQIFVPVLVYFLVDSIKEKWWTKDDNRIIFFKVLNFFSFAFPWITGAYLVAATILIITTRLIEVHIGVIHSTFRDYISQEWFENCIIYLLTFVVFFFYSHFILKKLRDKFRGLNFS